MKFVLNKYTMSDSGGRDQLSSMVNDQKSDVIMHSH